MRVAALVMVFAGVLASAGVRTQEAGTSPSSFEVAAVKLNNSGEGSSRTNSSGGGFTATNTTVRLLILQAFNLRDFQLTGGPGWIQSERYDITARAPEGSKYNRAMLQTLLEQRFKLVTHTETREQPVYALVLARSDGRLGPQVKPSKQECMPGRGADPRGPLVNPCGINSTVGGTGGKVMAVGQSFGALAAVLGGFGLGQMVIDRTGLTDRYDFDLQWSSEGLRAGPPDSTNTPGIFTALQEQLGLKLDAQRGPVESRVIDSIERPTPD